MANAQQSTNTLLSRHVVNGFRYQLAMNSKGREVMEEVFGWLYQGGPSIKDYFLSLGYTGAYYKRTFNGSQRTLIESGVSSDSYDISLFYVLLRHVCGLMDPSDPIWTTQQANPSLEYLLYRVKQGRNEVAHAHDAFSLSDQELQVKLDELKDLYCEILSLAAINGNVDPTIVDDLKVSIEDEFQLLTMTVREPLSPSDLGQFPQLQREIQMFQSTLQNQVETESKRELHDLYSQIWDVTLAQWLYPDLSIRPTSNFTNLVIEEDLSFSPPSIKFENPRNIPHEDLLVLTRRDGKLPDVLVVSGEGGIGKTTLLKYMIESWVTNPSQIKGLQDASPLLYFQLRGSNINSWKAMIKNLLRDTFQNSGVTDEYFADILLRLQTVVLLDGYDEVNQNSNALVADLLSLQGNMRILITTRPSSVNELTQKVSAKKWGMNVKMRGIRKEDRATFIQNTLTVLVQDSVRREQIQQKLIDNLDKLAVRNNGLEAPLMIILLSIREIEAPDQDGSGNVYEDLTKLMQKKVEERLVLKDIHDAERKVKEYHEFQKITALKALKRNEHDLLEETVAELKVRCDELCLPYKEMLSGFLSSKKVQQGLFINDIWSFPHNRFQEYWAASYIVTELATSVRTLPDLTSLLDMPNALEDEEDMKYKAVLTDNPVLQIYSQDPEEVRQLLNNRQNLEFAVVYGKQDKTCQLLLDILCNVTQILASSHINILEKIAPAVVAIVSYIGCSQSGNIIFCHELSRLIEASGSSSAILESSAMALQGRDIFVTKERFLDGLVALLQTAKPSHLSMFVEYPTWSPEKSSSVEQLSKNKINISLYFLRTHRAYRNSYVQIISKGEATLTYFRGFMDPAIIFQLPNSLAELHVETDSISLRSFAGQLPKLRSLQILDIKLLDRPNASTLSALPYMGRTLRLSFKDDLMPTDTQWVCDVVQKLCSSFRRGRDNRVIMPQRLYNVSEKFVTTLRARGITAVKKTWMDPEYPNLKGKHKISVGYSLW